MKPKKSIGVADRPLFSFETSSAEDALAMKARFQAAQPFPHIVIDDFLTLPPADVLPSFPGPDWSGWTVFQDRYQFNKRFCNDIDRIPSPFRDMIYRLSSPSFLSFMETITGIKGLIPDPYLTGGGLHSSGKGGVLAPHADFHHYHQLELFRRINILLYFNVDWRQTDGGSLELFGKANEDPIERIVPAYGRMVMFLTDNKSIHGFTQPIAHADSDRMSLALYYYTSEETRSFSGSGDTLWREHGKASGTSFLRLIIYKGMLRAAALLSRIAHAANPNLQKKPRKAD